MVLIYKIFYYNLPAPSDLSRSRLGGIVPYRAYVPLALNTGSFVATFQVLKINLNKIFNNFNIRKLEFTFQLDPPCYI